MNGEHFEPGREGNLNLYDRNTGVVQGDVAVAHGEPWIVGAPWDERNS